MNAETHLHLTSLQRAENLLRKIANGDQQALHAASDLADDLEALLHESGWRTTSEQGAGES
jgi:hypothetical protein